MHVLSPDVFETPILKLLFLISPYGNKIFKFVFEIDLKLNLGLDVSCVSVYMSPVCCVHSMWMFSKAHWWPASSASLQGPVCCSKCLQSVILFFFPYHPRGDFWVWIVVWMGCRVRWRLPVLEVWRWRDWITLSELYSFLRQGLVPTAGLELIL